MEDTANPNPVQPPLSQETPIAPPYQDQTIKRKNRAILILIILALLILSAISFYAFNSLNRQPKTAIGPTPTPVNMNEASTPSPTDTIPSDWVSYTTTKLTNNSLPAYSISYPATWEKEVKTEDAISLSTLILSNRGYEIKITQGPFDGALCIFEGPMPEAPSVDYKGATYTEIRNNTIVFRRILQGESSNGKTQLAFCANTSETPSIFGSVTPVGALTYSLPQGFTQDMLSEMDAIVKTITPISSISATLTPSPL